MAGSFSKVPGVKHYVAVDDGFASIVRSEGIAVATRRAAEEVAVHARIREEPSRYSSSERSTYTVEARDVTIGWKSRNRVGAAVVQEARSAKAAQDKILAWALAAARKA